MSAGVLHLLIPNATWLDAPGATEDGPSILERLGLPHPQHVTIGPSLFRVRRDVGAVVDLELRGLHGIDGDMEGGIEAVRKLLEAEL